MHASRVLESQSDARFACGRSGNASLAGRRGGRDGEAAGARRERVRRVRTGPAGRRGGQRSPSQVRTRAKSAGRSCRLAQRGSCQPSRRPPNQDARRASTCGRADRRQGGQRAGSAPQRSERDATQGSCGAEVRTAAPARSRGSDRANPSPTPPARDAPVRAAASHAGGHSSSRTGRASQRKAGATRLRQRSSGSARRSTRGCQCSFGGVFVDGG